MKSICLTSCHMGSWPSYMNLFLETCRHNPTVDFLFFSDCGSLPNAPSNVEVVPITIKEVHSRMRDKLGIEPGQKTPYGACDFRPTFGIVFDDYLEPYDFWGVTDVDLIYGNIRSFITDDLLKKNDIVSARAPYLTGFFFLFRNKDNINRLFCKSGDYKQVLEGSKYSGFDECAHLWNELIRGASIFDLDTEIESMTEVIQREKEAGCVKTHFADLGREWWTGRTFTWDKGRLFEGGEERMLLHFVIFKNWVYFTFPDWERVPSRFYVVPTGFYREGELNGLSYLRAFPAGKVAKRWLEQTAGRFRGRLPW